LKFGRRELKSSSQKIIGQKGTANHSKGFLTMQLQQFLSFNLYLGAAANQFEKYH
jgi:hypothetical protein